MAVVIVGLVMACLLSQVSIAATLPPETEKREKSHIAPLFTAEVQYWDTKIAKWSQEMGLDPNLVATVMQIESCGHPKAQSSAGAMGLFQVMPFHFQDGEDPFKPNINARRGLAYLKNALESRGGDPRLGFAGYNAGINGAKKPENAWPAETLRYVYWGTGIYADAKHGKSKSARLNEWLAAGGASLCRQAAQSLGIP
jgi:soluble lytic murein transglycosylase-like protein